MKTTNILPTNDSVQLQYRSLSLIDLVKRIVYHCDHQALTEFHTNRKLFSYNGSEPMLFIEFLNKLRESTFGREWSGNNAFEISDTAYDLTLEKFTGLPHSTELSVVSNKKNKPTVKHTGSDCRFYLRAFLERNTGSSKSNRVQSQIEEEYREARDMQGLVRRQYYLSFLEAKRKCNAFWSRYNWNIMETKICVWLPKALMGSERRAWLEKNIDDPCPSRPKERQRIQAIIDSKLIKERFVPISEAETRLKKEKPTYWLDSDEAKGISLAKTVAAEKALNIEKQRRSIREFGKEKLKHLILCVFENISSGESDDGTMARAFGLSKATFSRFAGSRWYQTDSAIPDLWLNTAQVLSTHTLFREVVLKTGFGEKVENTLKRGIPRI